VIDVAAKGYLKLNDAEQISQYFNNFEGVETNPSQNVYLIAANKINILSSQKRPACNFCGNLCGFLWYRKKSNSLTGNKTKEELILKQVGELDSLH
jgi:hypothetical protein